MKTILTIITLLIGLIVYAGDSELIKNVHASGTCEISNITPEQAQQIALDDARRNAIEKATGIHITTASIVSNGRLTADYIKATSAGYIINEQQSWHDIKRYEDNGKTVLVYMVEIDADVYIPQDKQTSPLTLDFPSTVLSGSAASLKIESSKDVHIAIFNVTSNDNVTMISPNNIDDYMSIKGGQSIVFPDKHSNYDMIFTNRDNHKEDTELFIIVAWAQTENLPIKEIFGYAPESMVAFYKKYAEICNVASDATISYNVVSQDR